MNWSRGADSREGLHSPRKLIVHKAVPVRAISNRECLFRPLEVKQRCISGKNSCPAAGLVPERLSVSGLGRQIHDIFLDTKG